MNLQELKQKSPSELISQAEKLGIENPSTLRKQEILFSILKKLADKKEQITTFVMQGSTTEKQDYNFMIGKHRSLEEIEDEIKEILDKGEKNE